VFAHNELDLSVDAAAVFEILVSALAWPSFYPNSADVRIGDGQAGALGPGTSFTWTTFAVSQQSRVTLFKRDAALGWTADSPGTRAYHRWLLEDLPGTGCRVVTEECQFGPLAWIGRRWMNPSLRAAHQLWLERLSKQAERASPSSIGSRS